VKRCIQCYKIHSDEDVKIYENRLEFDDNGRLTGRRVDVFIQESCPDCGAIVEDIKA
jgi:hypothetical protein